MESVVIKEVNGRCQLRKFIKFPNKLFKNVPTYIPPLMSDELGLLTKKNPSLDHCDLKMWLAYRNNEIVGRVAGIINYSVNERWNKKAVRFGWFDFIEDYDVFSKLLDTVIEYGKSKGMDEVEGPFGFTDMDKECWVIEGFDQRQNISTLYNPEYYIDFIRKAGFDMPCQWAQYQIPASQPIPEKVARINELILKKYNLKLLKFKSRKEVYPYAKKFFLAINSAFKDLYDFVPLTDKEIVDNILIGRMLLEEAEDLGLTASQEECDEMIASAKAAYELPEGKQMLDDWCADMDTTIDAYWAQLAAEAPDTIRREKVRSYIKDSYRADHPNATDEEVEKAYNDYRSQLLRSHLDEIAYYI